MDTLVVSVFVEKFTNKLKNPKNPKTFFSNGFGWINLYDCFGVFWGPENNHWIEGSGFL